MVGTLAVQEGGPAGHFDSAVEARASRAFGALNALEMDAAALLHQLNAYDDEQLYQAGEQALRYENLAWRIRCTVEYLLHERALSAGGPAQAAQEVGRMAARFALDGSTIYKEIQLYKTFSPLPTWSEPEQAAGDRLSKSHYVEALRAPDPPVAVEVFRAKADGGPFTRMDARAEVQRLQRSAQPHTLPTRRHGLLYAAPDWEALEQPAEQLGALRVWELAQPDAVLFLRCPPHRLPAALGVVRRWDFTYQTHVVLVTMPRLLDRLCGRLRVTHDLVLWAVRGMPPGAHTALEGSVMRADALYDTVAALYPSLEPAVVRAAGVCDTAAPWPTAGEPS